MMKEIEKLVERISREFRPEKIILFGSHAYGTANEDSDVDILIVMPFQGKPFRKSLDILNEVDPLFPIDLLVRRPEDTRRRYAEGDPLIREALDKGRVLYEQDH